MTSACPTFRRKSSKSLNLSRAEKSKNGLSLTTTRDQDQAPKRRNHSTTRAWQLKVVDTFCHRSFF